MMLSVAGLRRESVCTNRTAFVTLEELLSLEYYFIYVVHTGF